MVEISRQYALSCLDAPAVDIVGETHCEVRLLNIRVRLMSSRGWQGRIRLASRRLRPGGFLPRRWAVNQLGLELASNLFVQCGQFAVIAGVTTSPGIVRSGTLALETIAQFDCVSVTHGLRPVLKLLLPLVVAE